MGASEAEASTCLVMAGSLKGHRERVLLRGSFWGLRETKEHSTAPLIEDTPTWVFLLMEVSDNGLFPFGFP